MLRAAFLALLLLTTDLVGQSVVDPAPFEWVAATRATGFPFGYPTRPRVRVVQVHDGRIGAPRTITAVALRRTASDTTAIPAFDATVTLRLSHSPRTAATISNVFADNVGASAVTLLDGATVSFPATQPLGGQAPEPFEFVLQGSTPFFYDGVRPLCIDLIVNGHTNGTAFTFDLFEAERDYQGDAGTACGGTALTTSIQGSLITHTATSLPPGAPSYFLAGLDADLLGGGLSLPFDLTTIGAPGCVLYLDPLINQLLFADASGQLMRTLDLSPLPLGTWYLAQVGAVQPGVNPLGLVLTQANVVAPHQLRSTGRVWSDDLNATTGNVQPVFGWVVELR